MYRTCTECDPAVIICLYWFIKMNQFKLIIIILPKTQT